jgi:glycosyltransferase involved in cell wall biosynthesis
VKVSRRKLRVLFINDTARNGGPGRSLFGILKFLDPDVVERGVVLPRPGVISELLTGAGGGARAVDELHFVRHMVENPFEPWTRPMRRTDFEAPVAVRSARFFGNGIRGGLAVAELTAIVRRGGYDLVYCNGTNADFAGGAVAMATGVPAIWHVRYSSLPSLVRGVHDRLAASAAVARILCVSRASAALFPHVPEKVRVVHNGLDLEEFAPGSVVPRLRGELGISEKTFVFGSQGRVLRRKGYFEMVRAAKIALDRMTSEERARCAFVILGDTPEDFAPNHLEECRALVREIGVEGWVRFVGFRPDVRPYATAFDVAVVPSVYPDPLPRAVLESMALGKPVVAFGVGGVAEMLVDGETGVLVRAVPPDLQALASAMLRYLRDPDLASRHGAAGRARAVRDFDGKRQAKEIEDEIVRASRVTSPLPPPSPRRKSEAERREGAR